MADIILAGVDMPTFVGGTTSTPQLIDNDVFVVDAGASFAGGFFRVTGLLVQDRISIQSSGPISFDSITGEVSYNGVVIGVARGGVGEEFVVALNGAADAAGIEALVEHLTFANVSGDPAAFRTLQYELQDGSGNDNQEDMAWVFTPGVVSGLPGEGQVPTFADMDGDGDLDLLLGGTDNAHFNYFENTGGVSNPNYVQRAYPQDPFATITLDGIGRTAPLLIDWDRDGDNDLVVATSSGVHYFENEGTARAPVFTGMPSVSNPFASLNVGANAAVTLADMDGDGDRDLIAGLENRDMLYYQNTGTDAAPVWTLATGIDDPFRVLSFEYYSAPTVIDIDGDGDLDVVVGDTYGAIRVLENVGDATTPFFIEGMNPWGLAAQGRAAPTFADLDGDGDLDLVFSGSAGLVYLRNDTIHGAGFAVWIAPSGPTSGDDMLSGTAGNDSMEGLEGNDYLNGGDGDDYLKGGDGFDYLVGGNGNDTYIVDQPGETTDEQGGDGIDLVISRVSWTLAADIENLTLGSAGGNTDGTGNELNNVITGNAGANVLSGLDGEDTLIGGGGADSLYGGADNDTLDGGNGNDILDGGAGADQMTGGLGNDTYVVDNISDVVNEAVGQGVDTIQTNLDNVSLTDHAGIENLTLTTGAVTAWGNALANVITGAEHFNTLYGLDGADTLNGAGGDDLLVGGLGADKLIGGADADTFVFFSATEVNGDRILDLNFAEGDRIDLSSIDANENEWLDQGFTFVTRFTKVAGQATLTYNAVSNTTFLKLDIDGDGVMDAQLSLTGDYSGTKTNLWTGEDDTDGGWIL